MGWEVSLSPTSGLDIEYTWDYGSHSGGFLSDSQEETLNRRGEAMESLGYQQSVIGAVGYLATGNPLGFTQFRVGRVFEKTGQLMQYVADADQIIDVVIGSENNSVNIQTGASATSPNHARISASVDVPDLVRSASGYVKKRYIEYLQTPGPVYF